MTSSLSASRLITFEPNECGGRLKYFGGGADSHYWDNLWEQLEQSVDYGRYTKGHMPHQLRRTFMRWVPGGSRVLEAGCGLATFTVAAKALGFDAEGVDYAPRVIDKVQRRFPHIKFFVGDVRHLTDIDDAAYDALYSPGVCEHFEEGPMDVLREAHRVLRPRGIAIISTPCFNAFQKAMYRAGRFRAVPTGTFYQYAFSRQAMVRILDEIGFEVVQIHQYGTLLTFTDNISLLHRLLHPPLDRLIAFGLDSVPGVTRMGHTCIWVARKRD